MTRITLLEWSQAGPVMVEATQMALLKRECDALALGDRLRISPGFDGLRVESTSFVGRIDVGPLRIAVNPKLQGAPLARLLRYAYSLDELSAMPPDTALDVEAGGLQDLLIELLLDELESVWLLGLPKAYRKTTAELPVLRGRIRTEVLWRRGLLAGASLPCEYHERIQDWHLNRVLRTGLDLARQLSTRPAQCRRVDQVIGWFGPLRLLRPFGPEQVAEARANLTRMTSHAAPALELIRLLVEGVGIGFDGSQQRRGTSFLFDMNRFFQELVSRFLHDHLEYKVVDEAVLRGMYSPDITGRPRRPPAPRPDFAVIREGRVANYLDAKYRDLWVKPLPADWLYQLTAYALASPSGSATIVYPTMSDDARPESIGVNDPVSRRPLGRVLLKPVLLPALSALVLDRSVAAAHQKRRIAAELAGIPAEESRNVSSSISAEPASRSLFPKRSGLPSSRTQPAN